MPFRSAAVVTCAVLAVAALSLPACAPVAMGASKLKAHALVFPDRDNPDTFVLVRDFRVNETITNPDGDRFFILKTRQGTFEVPFDTVAEVEFTRFRAMEFLETATYDARVVLPEHGVRHGTIELRSLRGHAGRNPWHQLLMTRRENAARLHRIVFIRGDLY